MESPLTGGEYEIVVGAEMHRDWTVWFEDFRAESVGQTTRLVGHVRDQAELHGVLARLRDLVIPIVTINRLPDEHQPDATREDSGNTPSDT